KGFVAVSLMNSFLPVIVKMTVESIMSTIIESSMPGKLLNDRRVKTVNSYLKSESKSGSSRNETNSLTSTLKRSKPISRPSETSSVWLTRNSFRESSWEKYMALKKLNPSAMTNNTIMLPTIDVSQKFERSMSFLAINNQGKSLSKTILLAQMERSWHNLT